uniref:Uncharacterized protein n=1 Tax=Rhodopseudomonas palustris (strain BisA53) TaxID=316055 RepID=Q07SL3_RHOP5
MTIQLPTDQMPQHSVGRAWRADFNARQVPTFRSQQFTFDRCFPALLEPLRDAELRDALFVRRSGHLGPRTADAPPSVRFVLSDAARLE